MNKIIPLLLLSRKLIFKTSKSEFCFYTDENDPVGENLFDIFQLVDKYKIKSVSIELEDKEDSKKPNYYRSISDDISITDSDSDNNDDDDDNLSIKSKDIEVKENKRVCVGCRNSKTENEFKGNVANNRIFFDDKNFKSCFECRSRNYQHSVLRKKVRENKK
jgi:hypothetical protein